MTPHGPVEEESRLREQLQRMELLHQITRAISARLDVASVFQIVCNSVQTQLPADFVAIAQQEAGSRRLAVRCTGAAGFSLAERMGLAPGADVPGGQESLARCLGGELVLVPDTRRVEEPLPRMLAEQALFSAVMAPLQAESTVYGMLVVARAQAGAFTPAEGQFLRQLGEHVALASQQAQLHGALQRAFDELQRNQQVLMEKERLRALGQMAGGIAHDINNAISPVALYTESLLENEPGLSERGRAHLLTIQGAIDDVAKTVARMREFYRPREAQAQRTELDINSVVAQVVDLTRTRWHDMPHEGGVTINVETVLADGLPGVPAAERDVREALVNLIYNAVDAMPAGGHITVRTRAGEGRGGAGQLVVEVSDTGTGMDELTRSRCMEPFFSTKGERGTGLGLSMVYGTMQRHHGEFALESAPGRGTTVRLVFPSVAVPAPAPAPAQGAGAIGTPDAAAKLPKALRILLVDDDPMILRSLTGMLEIDGHEVCAAEGGQAGVDTFAQAVQGGHPHDLVITDLGMPIVDGHAVARAVKESAPHTPVVMLTGWGRGADGGADRSVHVDQFLSKPPRLAELRQALAALAPGQAGNDSHD